MSALLIYMDERAERIAGGVDQRQLALEAGDRRRRETMIRRRILHRAVFIAAGLYNIAWGIWSVSDPQWFFRFTGMPPANYPAIFACLGMVVGLYGILYLDVARRLERGWMIAAVGLAGKCLGPVGMVWLILTGVWPSSAIVLCVTNDFIWWIPFGMYLYDAWPTFRVTGLDVICCFCGNGLALTKALEIGITAPEDRKAVQGVYAHARCLAERLHHDVPLLVDHLGPSSE